MFITCTPSNCVTSREWLFKFSQDLQMYFHLWLCSSSEDELVSGAIIREQEQDIWHGQHWIIDQLHKWCIRKWYLNEDFLLDWLCKRRQLLEWFGVFLDWSFDCAKNGLDNSLAWSSDLLEWLLAWQSHSDKKKKKKTSESNCTCPRNSLTLNRIVIFPTRLLYN